MTAPNIPLKFIKTLNTTGSLSQAEAGRFFIKLLYEFWGFCVNGTSNLTVAGGFAPVSGVLCPDNFQSGSTVLWGQGNDGITDFGTNFFSSKTVTFGSLNLLNSTPGQLIGKYLVTWKPDSDSTDDSVYPIIAVVDNNTIRLETQVGGTRRLGNKAFFTKRTGVHFRVVDILAATKLASWTDGSGLVMQFNKASTVNPGQANSQVKVSLRNVQRDVGIIISPSGSWNGLNFTDGATEITSNWFYTATSGFGAFVLIGGRDCLLTNNRGIDGAWASGANTSGMHIEIPKRLLTASVDPNPVVFNMWANATLSQLASTYAGMRMVDHDGIIRPMITLARCPWGQHIDTAVTAVSGGIWQGFSTTPNRYLNMNYNPIEDKFITSDAVLGNQSGGHFSLARVRLRRTRFTANQQFKGFRYGDIDWVFMANGVLWPWDNTQLGYGMQPEGL